MKKTWLSRIKIEHIVQYHQILEKKLRQSIDYRYSISTMIERVEIMGMAVTLFQNQVASTMYRLATMIIKTKAGLTRLSNRQQAGWDVKA